MLLKEKIKIFLNNLRSLPSSSKRLLSLGMIFALVVALPLFIWAIVNQRFDIRKRAATGEPTPFPTSTPICKTGVNSFSVDTPCGTNGFRYMTFKCYDGYGGREGGPTSCKTSETWRSYAEKNCEGRSNCPTPTAIPTIYPSPRPTPTAKPTPTAWPSPRPTPTSSPTPNTNPVINTKRLPIAIYRKYYSTKISGYDWNKNDKLSMGIGGLPRGIKVAGCSNFFDKNGRNTITCKISGVPQSTGRHYVSVSLTDGNGGAAYKNFILWVFKPFFLK